MRPQNISHLSVISETAEHLTAVISETAEYLASVCNQWNYRMSHKCKKEMDFLAALRVLSVLLALWLLSGQLKLIGVLEERLCINLWTVIWIEDYGPQLRTDLIHCESESHNSLSLCFTMLQALQLTLFYHATSTTVDTVFYHATSTTIDTVLPCYKHYNWHCFTMHATSTTIDTVFYHATSTTIDTVFYHATSTTIDTCRCSHFHTIFIYIVLY